jgi:iron(III) transport system substrate-binding protein
MITGKKRRSPLVVAALAVSVAATACGGGSSSEETSAAPIESDTWASHDELVEAAKEEGALKVLTSMVPEMNEALRAGFMELYPEIETEVLEQQNDEGQKTLLELQAGQVDYDILHLGKSDGFAEFFPYLAEVDLLGLVEAGVIEMPTEVINPEYPNIMASGMGLGAVAWNKNLVNDDEVPSSYEDFLDPKWKGKFMVNIEGEHFAELFEVWGEEKTLAYAEDLAANDPVWTDSDTAGLTVMAGGEYPLYLNTNFHSAYRVQLKQPDAIGIKVLDPLPASFTQLHALRKDAAHPAAAVLFLEYLMTEEAQRAHDELEPAQASLYSAEYTSMAAKMLSEAEGEISVVNWDNFEKLPEWSEKVQSAWGFPAGEVTRK